MKKILFIIIQLAFPLYALSQTINITMEKDGGVYKVPCEVNGAKMKFVFDTGATMVTLSSSMAEYLYENDYLNDDDLKGMQDFVDANGKTTKHMVFNIRDLCISGLHIKNVNASVNPNQKSPLLLGLSAIQKLGKVSIHGNTLTIDVGDEVDELNPTSFLGIDFGLTRSKVRELLKQKYSSQFVEKNQDHCDYIRNVYINGLSFDYAFFYYDYSNKFVAASFSKSYKKSESKQVFKDRDAIANFYATKYPDIEKDIDDNNNYWYGCGGSYFIDDHEFWPIEIFIDSFEDCIILKIAYYRQKIVNDDYDNI